MYLLDDKYQVQSVLLWTCLDMFEFVTVICIFICWCPHLGDVPHDMLARLCLPAAGLPCKGFPCFLFHPFAFHIKYVVFSPHLHSWNVRKKIQICLLLFLELECNPVIPILRREMGGDPNQFNWDLAHIKLPMMSLVFDQTIADSKYIYMPRDFWFLSSIVLSKCSILIDCLLAPTGVLDAPP